MPKKVFNWFRIFMTLIMTAIFCLLMTEVTAGHVELGQYLMLLVIGLIVSVVLFFIVPTGLLAEKIALAYGAEPGSLWFQVINGFVISTVFTVVMSFIFTAIGSGFGVLGTTTYLDRACLGLIDCWPVAFVTTLFVQPIATMLAMKAAGVKPEPPKGPER